MIAAGRQRNPERSKARILAAAHEEFSQHGYAGARVERIAGKAGLNKQLISHHFGGKQALYDAVLAARRAGPGGDLTAQPGTMPDALAWFFDRLRADPEWVRMLQWEALEAEADVPGTVEVGERRRRYAERVAWVGDEQSAGRLPPDLDPDLLLLSLVGAAAYPLLVPQVARLIAGEAPDFADRYRQHLTRLAAALAVASDG